MRRKHHVSVRDFRSGEMSQGADAGASMFSAERHLAEAFSSASVGSEEDQDPRPDNGWHPNFMHPSTHSNCG